MITPDNFTGKEKALLLELLRSIDRESLGNVFDARDAAVVENAKTKLAVMVDDWGKVLK